MGLGPEDLRVLKEARQAHPEGRNCLILGHCTFWYKDGGGSKEDFAKELDFDLVETIDVNGEPDHKLDLQGLLPDCLYQKYDWVLDVGVLYCVFDVSSVLYNMTQYLLKDKGVIWHQTNLSAHFGRGFWAVSPSVLYEFYSQNGFVIERMGYYVKGGENKWKDFQPGLTYLRAANQNDFFFDSQNCSVKGLIPGDSSLMCLASRKKKKMGGFIKPVPDHYIRTNGK